MLSHEEAQKLDLRVVSEKLTKDIETLIANETAELEEITARIKELNYRLQNDPDLQTDRSENASFQIAKDERDVKVNISNIKMARIESLRSELGNYTSTGYITLGTTVELRVIAVKNYDSLSFLKRKVMRGNREVEELQDTAIFKLVRHNTSNAKCNLVSIDYIVGKAITGRTAGEVVTVTTPLGEVTYKIERIY